MYFESTNNLTIHSDKTELNGFLKDKTTELIEIESNLSQIRTYSLVDDYDRFIISQKAMPFQRYSVLETHVVLKISAIDANHSKLDYTIKYTELSYLVILAIHVLIISFTIAGTNFNFFDDSLFLGSFISKLIVTIIEVIVLNGCLWLNIFFSKEKYTEIIDQLIRPLKS